MPKLARVLAIAAAIIVTAVTSGTARAAVDQGSSTTSSGLIVFCNGSDLNFSQPYGANSYSVDRNIQCLFNGHANMWMNITVYRTVSGVTSVWASVDITPYTVVPPGCMNTTSCSIFSSGQGLPGGQYQAYSTASFAAYPDGSPWPFPQKAVAWLVSGGGPTAPQSAP